MVECKVSVFYIEDLQPAWTKYQSRYRIAVGLIFGLLSWLSYEGLEERTFFTVLASMAGGLLFMQTYGSKNIEFSEKLNFSLRLPFLSEIIVCICSFLFISIVFGLLGEVKFGVIIGIMFAAIFLLIILSIEGLQRESRAELRMKPNASFGLILKNGLRTGAIVGLILGLIFGLSSILTMGLISSLNFGIAIGLLFGLISAGGNALIQHIALRLILLPEQVIPRWRYDKFLDHCAELGLLRKVGGGYIFRHRLLLEYFAEQYAKQHQSD